MEAKMKCISVVIFLLVFFKSLNPSRAMSMETNSSTSIAVDNELEFLMDSNSSRILQSGRYVTTNTGNAGRRAAGCGRYRPYDPCIPNPNRPKVPENCGAIYNRACGRR
ncbi:hypothetical protein DITRI_Ditri11bG0030600 [Diplodiscus trichospermus]